MTGIEVDHGTLIDARHMWVELSQDLRVAVNTLEDAPQGGFPSSVAPTVASFMEVWSAAAGDMATAAQELKDDVGYALETFHDHETTVADVLKKTDVGEGS